MELDLEEVTSSQLASGRLVSVVSRNENGRIKSVRNIDVQLVGREAKELAKIAEKILKAKKNEQQFQEGMDKIRAIDEEIKGLLGQKSELTRKQGNALGKGRRDFRSSSIGMQIGQIDKRINTLEIQKKSSVKALNQEVLLVQESARAEDLAARKVGLRKGMADEDWIAYLWKDNAGGMKELFENYGNDKVREQFVEIFQRNGAFGRLGEADRGTVVRLQKMLYDGSGIFFEEEDVKGLYLGYLASILGVNDTGKSASPANRPSALPAEPNVTPAADAGAFVGGNSQESAAPNSPVPGIVRNSAFMLIPMLELKGNGILSSFTSGLAPPALFHKISLSSTEVFVIGAIVVGIVIAVAGIIWAIRSARSATSRNGESGQDAEGASSKESIASLRGVRNSDSRVATGNSIGNKIAREIVRITGSIGASFRNSVKAIKEVAVKVIGFVAGSSAAAAQHIAVKVRSIRTSGAAKIRQILGSIRAYSFHDAFINLLSKIIVIPSVNNSGRPTDLVIRGLRRFISSENPSTFLGRRFLKWFNDSCHRGVELNRIGTLVNSVFGAKEKTPGTVLLMDGKDDEKEAAASLAAGKTVLRKLFVTHFPEAVQVMDTLIDVYLGVEIKKLNEQGVMDAEQVAVENIIRRLEERGNALLDLVNDPDLREFVKKEIDDRIKAGRTDVSLYELLLLWNDGIEEFKESLRNNGQVQRSDFYRDQVFYEVTGKEEIVNLYKKGIRSLRFVRLLEAGDLTSQEFLTLSTNLYMNNGEYWIWGIYTGYHGETKYLNMSLSSFWATSRRLIVAMNADDANA
ncbi:MAG: hypothetical protein PHH57_08775, partial [Candidatus Omnitrophica bacterium]|nr:hypothetical protein [Candidatus Omnitrophota bacterium]